VGRGNRPPHSGAHLRGVVTTPLRYEVFLAAEAEDELVELIRYIRKDRPQNAAVVLAAIRKRRDALGANPRLGHADPNAPLVPAGASALLTTVKGIGIYYLFPMQRHAREIVYIVSVRRGLRMPLERSDYARRWVEEASKVPPLEGRLEQDD
jgi:plasmid stabilization system protein ParE